MRYLLAALAVTLTLATNAHAAPAVDASYCNTDVNTWYVSYGGETPLHGPYTSVGDTLRAIAQDADTGTVVIRSLTSC